jgi:hypothetical protein
MDYRYPYFAILLIGIFYGSVRYRSLTVSNRSMLVLLIITCISESIAYYLAIKKMPNLQVYNIFMFIQTVLLGISFGLENIKWGSILLICGATIAGITISLITLSEINILNLNGLIIVLFLMTILALLFLYQLMKKDTSVALWQFPFFWLSIGLLFFGVLNILGFGLMYISDLNFSVLERFFFTVRIYSNYFLYTLFIVAFAVPQNRLKYA